MAYCSVSTYGYYGSDATRHNTEHWIALICPQWHSLGIVLFTIVDNDPHSHYNRGEMNNLQR